MLCSDVGAYQKLNMKTLQDIITIQLQCFQKEGAKRFIFCLRDFDERFENLEHLQKTIEQSMQKIWAKVPKPVGKEDMNSSEIFTIEVFPFHSFRTDFDKFATDCKAMRKKLEEIDTSALNNLPLDGLVEYLKSSWEIIKNNKDLNIPDQKRIVSKVRCKEEAETILAKSTSSISGLISDIGQKRLSVIGQALKEMLNKSENEYLDNTKFYEDAAKKENLKDYKDKLSWKLKDFAKKSFDNDEKLADSKIEILSNQLQRQEQLDINSLKRFKTLKIELFTLLDHNRSQIDIQGADAENLANQKKMKIVSKLKVALGNLYVRVTDNMVRDALRQVRKVENEFQESFCEQNFERILESGDKVFKSLHKRFEDVYDSSPELFSEINETFYVNLANKVCGRVKERLENMNYTTVIVRAFRSRFSRNKRGAPRDWKRLEKESIERLYHRTRGELLKQMEFLDEAILVNGEEIELATPYMTIKSDVEIEFENIFKDAMDKHHAAGMLKSVPKVAYYFYYTMNNFFCILFFNKKESIRWI